MFPRCVALLALAGRAGSSAGSDAESGTVDGPVMPYAERASTGEGRAALVRGRLERS